MGYIVSINKVSKANSDLGSLGVKLLKVLLIVSVVWWSLPESKNERSSNDQERFMTLERARLDLEVETQRTASHDQATTKGPQLDDNTRSALEETWSSLLLEEGVSFEDLTVADKDHLDKMMILGAPLSRLDKLAQGVGFTRRNSGGLPSLKGAQSLITLQVVGGRILGAELQFVPGATAAAWGMVVEALGGNKHAEGEEIDPMMMIDELSNPSHQYEAVGYVLQRLGDGCLIVSGKWERGETHSVKYVLKVNPRGEPELGRLWLSR